MVKKVIIITMQHLIITGIQGSGKGTQARKIAQVFGWVHIGTGDWCRWHIKNQTLYGKQLLSINKGNLVSDDLIIKLVQLRLDLHDPKLPFILDGFPRSVPQVNYLFQRYPVGAVINLALSEEEALTRAMSRMEAGEARKDDNLDALRLRFNLYRQYTEPLLEIYKEKNILIDIDASGTIESVFEEISGALLKRNLVTTETALDGVTTQRFTQ